MQGVIRSYDPLTGEGALLRDTDRTEFVLATDALEHSILRTVRQGQRVTFHLDADGRATSIALGSEVDMGLPTARV
jgi:cold shock CspA family protein